MSSAAPGPSTASLQQTSNITSPHPAVVVPLSTVGLLLLPVIPVLKSSRRTGREELINNQNVLISTVYHVCRTGVVSVCVLGAAAAPQTLQAIVGDLQDETTVHYAVG